ncbi:SPOR domain-containing protein [Pinirhizobacter sp.]|jgi:cell division septation protein DedD|uniref:SPOR domain-containing protein n=1 Tax=Pinirhizobacter sp. TaxID=2950432 RepID=UPI002F41B1F4
MFAKLGLILLIVLFGALAFAGGMAAPDHWRAPMLELAASWHAHAAPPTVLVPASPATAATPAPSASAVSTASLLVASDVAAPLPAPGQPAYALQLGQFVVAGDADALERQSQGLGLPLRRISAVDPDHTSWIVLAAGRFPSPAAAQDAAARVQAVLKLASTPVIRLPADGKPSP